MILIHDFSGVITDKDDLKKPESATLAMLKRIPLGFTGVVASHMNMCGTLRFMEIIREAQDKGLFIKLWRHPRLHNDSFYFILSALQMKDAKGQILFGPKPVDCLKFQFNMAQQIIDNNTIRDNAMWMGFIPKRPVNVVPKLMMEAFGAQMRVRDQFKSMMKTSEKYSSVGNEALREVVNEYIASTFTTMPGSKTTSLTKPMEIESSKEEEESFEQTGKRQKGSKDDSKMTDEP